MLRLVAFTRRSPAVDLDVAVEGERAGADRPRDLLDRDAAQVAQPLSCRRGRSPNLQIGRTCRDGLSARDALILDDRNLDLLLAVVEPGPNTGLLGVDADLVPGARPRASRNRGERVLDRLQCILDGELGSDCPWQERHPRAEPERGRGAGDRAAERALAGDLIGPVETRGLQVACTSVTGDLCRRPRVPGQTRRRATFGAALVPGGS